MIYEDDVIAAKLIIKPTKEGSLQIYGYIPSSINERYTHFDSVYISNEKTEKKFKIRNNYLPGYSYIEPGILPLSSTIALGNVLRVYLRNYGDRF
jgi:hypothetical protein